MGDKTEKLSIPELNHQLDQAVQEIQNDRHDFQEFLNNNGIDIPELIKGGFTQQAYDEYQTRLYKELSKNNNDITGPFQEQLLEAVRKIVNSQQVLEQAGIELAKQDQYLNDNDKEANLYFVSSLINMSREEYNPDQTISEIKKEIVSKEQNVIKRDDISDKYKFLREEMHGLIARYNLQSFEGKKGDISEEGRENLSSQSNNPFPTVALLKVDAALDNARYNLKNFKFENTGENQNVNQQLAMAEQLIQSLKQNRK
jgi:hypothetical protein